MTRAAFDASYANAPHGLVQLSAAECCRAFVAPRAFAGEADAGPYHTIPDAKLVSLVACRDSSRYENQSILRYLFNWLARFVFVSSVQASQGFVCVRQRFRNFYRQVINNTTWL